VTQSTIQVAKSLSHDRNVQCSKVSCYPDSSLFLFLTVCLKNTCILLLLAPHSLLYRAGQLLTLDSNLLTLNVCSCSRCACRFHGVTVAGRPPAICFRIQRLCPGLHIVFTIFLQLSTPAIICRSQGIYVHLFAASRTSSCITCHTAVLTYTAVIVLSTGSYCR
jgi:hypothetical protein